MKDQRGITLITLIITIILALIVVSIVTNEGMETYESSQMVKFVTYMQSIQKKVDLILETNEDYMLLGDSLTTEQKDLLQEILNSDNEEFITLDVNDEGLRYFGEEKILSDLDLSDINDNIVVNFKTREVISLNGIEYENSIWNSQYKLPKGQSLILYTITDRIINSDSFYIKKDIEGLNATILVTIDNSNGIENGKLSYQKANGYWTTITNTTQKGKTYSFNVSESGTYVIKLVDNLNVDTYTTKSFNIKLANGPELEENMILYNENYDYTNLSLETFAYATCNDNGTTEYYVWIPRFVYDIDDPSNIEFIKGNSNITTSNTYIDTSQTNSTWILPPVFLDEKTGVWIEIDSIEGSNTENIINIVE